MFVFCKVKYFCIIEKEPKVKLPTNHSINGSPYLLKVL